MYFFLLWKVSFRPFLQKQEWKDVPETAVVTNPERRIVIRLKDNKAEPVDVIFGISQDDKVEIFGNLEDGDLLLLRATDEIKPGTRLIAR